MHLAVFLDGIAQFIPVVDNFAVNENEDVLAQGAPFVHDVAADAGVMGINALQQVGQAGAVDFRIF